MPVNPAGNFNPEVFSRLAQGRTVRLPNFGMETLHHVHAEDVAQSFVRAMERRDLALGGELSRCVWGRSLVARIRRDSRYLVRPACAAGVPSLGGMAKRKHRKRQCNDLGPHRAFAQLQHHKSTTSARVCAALQLTGGDQGVAILAGRTGAGAGSDRRSLPFWNQPSAQHAITLEASIVSDDAADHRQGLGAMIGGRYAAPLTRSVDSSEPSANREQASESTARDGP